MNALLYDKRKGFVYGEAATPVPRDDEVLVKVAAVSINAADYRMMKLGMIPKSRIFGSGIAGTITALGSAVKGFAVGDDVCADTAESGFGGLCEYAAIPAMLLAKKPAGLSFEAAATIPLAAVTALQALKKSGIKTGQKILIIGAGGGVGSFAVQLARHFGAAVTAVCGSKNAPVITALGAAHVIDYTAEDLTKLSGGFDAILAVNGKYPLSFYRRLLAPGGHGVVVGGALSQVFKTMLFGGLMSRGGKRLSVLSARPNASDLAFVLALADEGRITPVIDRRASLPDAADAFLYLSRGHALGKVVVTV